MITKKNTTTKLIYSEAFRNILLDIHHYISDDLINIENEIESKFSYIDISHDCKNEEKDYISFIQSAKVEALKDQYSNWEELVWTKSRCNMKIGKFIVQLLGDRYPNNKKQDPRIINKPNCIESFVNNFKMYFDFINYKNNFELVDGDKITYWYNENNYSERATSSNSLGNSCMRYERYGKFTEIYASNKDKVKLLIYKDSENKLLGRALVWFLDEPVNTIYMDRIYYTEDKIVDLFKKYAKEQGWLYKSKQTYGRDIDIVEPNNNFNLINIKMKVDLKSDYYRWLPYLDTLSIYDNNSKILTNSFRLIKDQENVIECTGYEGSSVIDLEAYKNGEGYREYSDNYDNVEEDTTEVNTVWSDYHDGNIPRHCARWCEIGGTYANKDEAIYVFNSGGKYALPNSELIVKCDYNDKWFLKASCVWSDYYATWLFNESVIKAWVDVDKTNYHLMHKNDRYKYFSHENEYYIISEENDKILQNNENTTPDISERSLTDRFQPLPESSSNTEPRIRFNSGSGIIHDVNSVNYIDLYEQYLTGNLGEIERMFRGNNNENI